MNRRKFAAAAATGNHALSVRAARERRGSPDSPFPDLVWSSDFSDLLLDFGPLQEAILNAFGVPKHLLMADFA